MLFLRSMLVLAGFAFLVCAVGVVFYDAYLAFELSRLLHRGEPIPEPAPPEAALGARQAPQPRRAMRWKMAAQLTFTAALASLTGSAIVVVPDGHAAVRISQLSGVRPGTLYAGTHFIAPLIERVEIFDIRDRVFSTSAAEGPHERLETLTVEAREGLSVGLAVAVRYRIDPRRLDYIQANLPQPVEEQIVAPVVTSAFRELGPNYIVRDLFATKRAEFRERASAIITTRLGGDAIVVKEVLLRKVLLPDDYAKGLEDLLLKEEQDDQTAVEADIEKKRVKIAESQADAAKIREVKRAEADGQSRVIMAKAESDAMQYTLPLKQKQIEQSRLEAEARKAATIQNAEAEAQAKVIDSKAEQERRNLLADAEANHIRVTSKAHAEQLELEAAALRSNPLLVQYTVAQRLSDKVRIMLVPNDGKLFFTSDVLRSALGGDATDGSPARTPLGSNAAPAIQDARGSNFPVGTARDRSEIDRRQVQPRE